ncbi:HET-domain-containing protein [Aspergillus sclerotiicarbonarius CBS 121057]|uniref:HET-domain-containing protein n=1 Tax=Aspergillus sclerotiicarbonarius (strain CBS 121057 / IBT 28362) TaxID=1448318 RepID=A0A319E0Z6_ASPSB|nr:HET-domain-containing protein [Aspergillus sclerotiicarbonarius CBS 121057]
MPGSHGNPCFICMDLIHSRRVALAYRSNLDDSIRTSKLSKRDCEAVFHWQETPTSSAESLCSFCAHLGLERLVQIWSAQNRSSFYNNPLFFTSISEEIYGVHVFLGQISDLQARQDECFLCARLVAIATREGDIDARNRIWLEVLEDSTVEAFGFSTIKVHIRNRAGGDRLITELNNSAPHNPLPSQDDAADFTCDCSVGEIDWLTVTKWFEGSRRGKVLDEPPVDFRLIDVQKLCVVRAPTTPEYICLSYVWGNDTSFQTTFHTINDFEEPNSLASFKVPDTIANAITVCAALGKRYLWVDRLCIIQDEENNPSKQAQIDAMGGIYGGAFATLIAFEGTDARYGLHGVSPALKRAPYYRIRIGGELFFERTRGLWSSRERSKWHTRGWTYQEAILSPRLLFFTKHGLYFEDSSSVIKNDIQRWAAAMYDPPIFGWPSDRRLKYVYVMPEYTKREFGDERDIVNGASGILDTSVGKGNHRFAMPLVGFDAAILWTTRPRCPSLSRQGRASAFPTWSWASIKGSIQYPHYGFRVSVACWGIIDAAMPHDILWLRPQSNYDHSDHVIAVETLLWRHGCMPIEFPPYLGSKHSFQSFAKVFHDHIPTMNMFYQACGASPDHHGMSMLFDRFTSDQIQAGRHELSLLAHSQTIILRLKPFSDLEFIICYEEREIGVMRFDLLSEHSRARNTLETEPIDMEFLPLSVTCHLYSYISRREYNWHYDAVESLDQIRFNPKRPQGQIVTANDSPFRDTIPLSDSTPYPYYTYENDEGACFRKLDMQVMAIRTTDGISCRLGLGCIPLVTWLTLLKPTSKSIVLR